MYSVTVKWETRLFPFASLLMEYCLILEAFKNKIAKLKQSLGLCLLISMPEKEEEMEAEVPLR